MLFVSTCLLLSRLTWTIEQEKVFFSFRHSILTLFLVSGVQVGADVHPGAERRVVHEAHDVDEEGRLGLHSRDLHPLRPEAGCQGEQKYREARRLVCFVCSCELDHLESPWKAG